MPSIESIGYPLVYKADPAGLELGRLMSDDDVFPFRIYARGLEGMQKEALVHESPSGAVWRMVSDEGRYLHGTDLAPSPLSIYGAGMILSLMEELLKHARAAGVELRALMVHQDSYYTVEGSALRGDMTGGARPVELSVEVEADADFDTAAGLLRLAERTSPAQAYMRRLHANTFALCLQGEAWPVARVRPSARPLAPHPDPIFEGARPASKAGSEAEIITKVRGAEQLTEGGTASSLQVEQKRTLHLRGTASLRPDGLKEATVQLVKPSGSVYRFLSAEPEPDGRQAAPSSLAYLSAGVAFCFMTQLGRYARIVKQPLDAYHIDQENVYRLQDGEAVCDPVDTHVFVDAGLTPEQGQQLVSMGEQTCFLHAAMRTENPSHLRLVFQGNERLLELS